MAATLRWEIRTLNRIRKTDAKLCHTVTTRLVVYLLFQLQLSYNTQTRQNAISEQETQLLFAVNRRNTTVRPFINNGKYLPS